MGQKMEAGVNLVDIALTVPDGLSFWIFATTTVAFGVWVVYLAFKH